MNPNEATGDTESNENISSDHTQALAALEQQLSDCQEKYLRLLAESENSRKRMQKEKQDLSKYAVENVIVEFLSPLDSFEKALNIAENMSDEVRNWAIGFEMILNQFKQVLSDQGVSSIDSTGKQFDPRDQEAIEVVETTEFPSGTIIQEFLKGYRMGDRMIRPARVKVAKAPETPPSKEATESNPKKV